MCHIHNVYNAGKKGKEFIKSRDNIYITAVKRFRLRSCTNETLAIHLGCWIRDVPGEQLFRIALKHILCRFPLTLKKITKSLSRITVAVWYFGFSKTKGTYHYRKVTSAKPLWPSQGGWRPWLDLSAHVSTYLNITLMHVRPLDQCQPVCPPLVNLLLLTEQEQTAV